MASKQPIILTDEILAPPALIRAGLDALPSIIRAQANAPAAASSSSSPPTSATAISAWRTHAPLKQFFEIEPFSVAAYIEQLGAEASKPTVKQHLAAIRKLFDYLTTGGILESNPAKFRART